MISSSVSTGESCFSVAGAVAAKAAAQYERRVNGRTDRWAGTCEEDSRIRDAGGKSMNHTTSAERSAVEGGCAAMEDIFSGEDASRG